MKFKKLGIRIQASLLAISVAIIANLLTSLIKYIYKNNTGFIAASIHIFETYYAVFIILGTVFFFFYPAMHRRYRLSSIARSAGLYDWQTENKHPQEKKNSESSTKLSKERKAYIQKIKNHCKNNESLSILSSDGSIFSNAEESLLGGLLGTAKTNINIYLLDPGIEAKAAKARAKALNIDTKEYRENIVASIRHLKELQETRTSVSLRVFLYDFLPQFEIVKSDDMIWLSYHSFYFPVDEAPIFSFKKQKAEEKPKSLYCFFDEYLKDLSHPVQNELQPLSKAVCLIEDLDQWKIPFDLLTESEEEERSQRDENSFKEYIRKLVSTKESNENIRRQVYSVDSRIYTEKLIPELREALANSSR